MYKKRRMKVQNLNNSSKKTRRAIKKTFAEMLAEKREISKISVSELCKKAEISRGTFYAHYDDIYGVVEDYEAELVELFFSNERLLSVSTAEQFIETVFEYVRQNDENYKRICLSDDFLFTARRLTTMACNRFLQICYDSPYLKDRELLETEINVFIEGLVFEYMRYCRDSDDVKLDTLYKYTKAWASWFTARRFDQPPEEEQGEETNKKSDEK